VTAPRALLAALAVLAGVAAHAAEPLTLDEALALVEARIDHQLALADLARAAGGAR
jgi:hypothetical protein